MAWKKIHLLGDVEHTLVIGKAGDIPAATSDDCADFNLIVPWNMTLTRLKASAKTAPSSNTTIQMRRSENQGSSFSNAFGSVTINSSAKMGTSDPSDLNVNEGDMLQMSITAGGGSGTNAALHVIGKMR